MDIFNSPYIKKAFFTSLFLEIVLSSLWIGLSIAKGQSGFTIGMALHFPSSLLGVLIGESVRDFHPYLSLILCYAVSIVCQLVILTLIFRFILQRRDNAG